MVDSCAAASLLVDYSIRLMTALQQAGGVAEIGSPTCAAATANEAKHTMATTITETSVVTFKLTVIETMLANLNITTDTTYILLARQDTNDEDKTGSKITKPHGQVPTVPSPAGITEREFSPVSIALLNNAHRLSCMKKGHPGQGYSGSESEPGGPQVVLSRRTTEECDHLRRKLSPVKSESKSIKRMVY